MIISKEQKEAFSKNGKIGGAVNAKRRGKKGMSALGRKGAIARWKNHKKKLSTGK